MDTKEKLDTSYLESLDQTVELIKGFDLDFIKLTKDGIAISDVEGKVYKWNDAMVRITGVGKEEAMSSLIWDLQYSLAPNEIKEALPVDFLKENFAKIYENPNWFGASYIQRIHTRKGEVIYVEDNSFLINKPGKKLFVTFLTDVTEKELTLQKLKSSEERYFRLFNNSPYVILMSRISDGHLTEVNPAFTTFSGYSRAEVIGKTTIELNLWKYPKEREEMMEILMSKGPFQQKEYTFIKKNGEELIGLLSVEIIQINNETYILGNIVDITENRKNQEIIRLSEARLRLVTENTVDIIWVLDPIEQRYTYVSPAVTKMLGYSVEEMIHLGIYDHLTEASKQEMQLLLASKLAEYEKLLPSQQLDAQFEVTMVAKSGEKVFSEIKASLFKNQDGRPEIIGVTRDITERKKQQEKLLESKLQYDLLVSKIPVGVYIIRSKPDGSFIFEYVSPKYLQIVKLTEEQIFNDGMLAFKMIIPDDFPSFMELNLRVNQELVPFHWTGRVKVENQTRWFELNSIPEKLHTGEVLWHGLLEDVTEKKLFENMLKNKMDELLQFQRLTVGRELKMIELKKEINALYVEMGKEEKYHIVG